MIFKSKKHNTDLYNTLLLLSRNVFFYNKLKFSDSFETRIYLIFIHFSIMMIIFKKKGSKFEQKSYDFLFLSIENNTKPPIPIDQLFEVQDILLSVGNS